MPDLRTVLTETLRGHALHSVTGNDWGCNCGERFTHLPDFYGHQAEALLSLPGVAVTQPELGDLPEPVMAQFEKLPFPMRMRVTADVMDAVNARFRSENPQMGFTANEPISASSMRGLADQWQQAAVVLPEGETRNA